MTPYNLVAGCLCVLGSIGLCSADEPGPKADREAVERGVAMLEAGASDRESGGAYQNRGGLGSRPGQGAAPQIVAMNPPNGAKDVDPATRQLRVTFNMPMSGDFSWTGGGPQFPKTTGRPRWIGGRKTCVLPVKLEPNWDYRLGLNSPSFKNFKSAAGVPLEPVEYTFTTIGAGAAPGGDNILGNPGMEKGAIGPQPWEQGASVPGVQYSWDKEVAFAGKASLCIEKKVKRYFPITQWSQTVERKGDMPAMEVSAQVKADKMHTAILEVLFLDKDGKRIEHQWAAYIGGKQAGDPPANHDWKEYSGTVEIPAGTAKICIGLQAYGPGKVWFDDVEARYVK